MRWDRCGEIQRQKVRAYLVLGLLSAALAVVLAAFGALQAFVNRKEAFRE